MISGGTGCKDIDECVEYMSDPFLCPPGTDCQNTIGNYVCEDQCSSGLITCSPETQCVKTDTSYYCGCNEGYTVDAQCLTCIAEGIVGNIPDSEVCAGMGKQGPGDGKCCNNIDECATSSHACDEFSTCIDTIGSYVCDCKPGLTWSDDNSLCVDFDECALDKHQLRV